MVLDLQGIRFICLVSHIFIDLIKFCFGICIKARKIIVNLSSDMIIMQKVTYRRHQRNTVIRIGKAYEIVIIVLGRTCCRNLIIRRSIGVHKLGSVYYQIITEESYHICCRCTQTVAGYEQYRVFLGCATDTLYILIEGFFTILPRLRKAIHRSPGIGNGIIQCGRSLEDGTDYVVLLPIFFNQFMSKGPCRLADIIFCFC